MNRIEKDEDEYDDDGNLIIQVDRQTDADRQIEKDTNKQTNGRRDRCSTQNYNIFYFA